jgi:hypothetical protein
MSDINEKLSQIGDELLKAGVECILMKERLCWMLIILSVENYH